MTCPGSQNLPLAELGCWPKQSRPGVLALPTRLTCCSGQIRRRPGGVCPSPSPCVFIWVYVSGLGWAERLSITVGIHNITFFKSYLCLSPDQEA